MAVSNIAFEQQGNPVFILSPADNVSEQWRIYQQNIIVIFR